MAIFPVLRKLTHMCGKVPDVTNTLLDRSLSTFIHQNQAIGTGVNICPKNLKLSCLHSGVF